MPARRRRRFGSYRRMISVMTSVERVTVSLPAQVRQAAQQIAESTGTSFSAVVTSALESWMRGRLADAWLADYQAEHGAFTEEELERLATEAGVPYLPPAGRPRADQAEPA